MPARSAQLIITSPPYNIGKTYENATYLDRYLRALTPIIDELVRVLGSKGSLCWQVGNYVKNSEVFPLDIFYYPFFKNHGLKLRNRIVWHFAHGLHATKRFSGRYEVLLWFTKGDSYTFNLDEVRVPPKYHDRPLLRGVVRTSCATGPSLVKSTRRANHSAQIPVSCVGPVAAVTWNFNAQRSQGTRARRVASAFR